MIRISENYEKAKNVKKHVKDMIKRSSVGFWLLRVVFILKLTSLMKLVYDTCYSGHPEGTLIGSKTQ